jgi:hypothetical protein
MNQKDFFENLLDYSRDEDFSFFTPGEKFNDPKKLSWGKQALVAAMSGAAYGLIGSLSSGYSGSSTRDNLIADMQNMHEHCDLVAIKLSHGPVLVRLGIDADNLSGETLVGHFALIHERLYDFCKHAPSVMPGGKLATAAQVVVVFSTHKRAKEFIDKYAGNCKHTAFWKKIYTQPWVVDLEDEEIKRFRQPLSDLVANDSEKLKAGLFRRRG